MRKKNALMLSAVALFALIQCETPGSPDFTISNKIDTPLVAQSNFQFLGDKNALIDTTSKNFKDLFTTDVDHFITLSQEDSFDFGDLHNAIPVIDTEPVQFQTEVGEIELNDFSSKDDEGNLGDADFQELTGQPSQLQQGEQLPGAQSPSPVNIDIETDYFVNAQIKQGGIEITLQNDLGFDLEQLTLELNSGSTFLGSIIITDFLHKTTRSDIIQLVDNPDTDPEVELSNINTDVSITWSTQTMQDDSGRLIINNLNGSQLVASSVYAVIRPQSFQSSGSTVINDADVRFNEKDHYVELESGTLSVQNIINSIDLDIDVLEITFPGLRTSPYSEADSLVIRFEDDHKILRKNATPVNRSQNLKDVRIYAENNVVDFHIYAITEDTDSEPRTVHESDQVNAEVILSDLEIREVFGIITNKQILLNLDIAADGDGVDIMNDLEAEVIEMDGVNELSRWIEGIEFTRASLDILYQTNVGIQTSVIGAFLGTDANGNQFFLRGEPGTEAEVLPADPTSQLKMNGTEIESSNLIKFNIDSDQSVGQVLSNTFDRSNSNITEFLNRLPTSIRYIGMANINENGDAGKIQNPVRFDPITSINIPLSMRAENASFIDTTAANLKNLPGPEENAVLEDGTLTFIYTNNIPVGINLEVEFLTEGGDAITTVPLQNGNPIQLRPALVNSSGVSTEPTQNITEIQLNRSQLDVINLTRYVRLIAQLNTTASEEIRIRSNDDVDIAISGRFTINNIID